MGDFCFCIISLDQTVQNRWQAAFKKEGWETRVFDCLHAACAGGGSAELDLIEIGPQLCRTPEDLQKVIKARNPVATLTFAPQQSISNSQIVQFLESGADDFVFSNMDERVIVAKLKTYMRRLAPLISKTLSALASSGRDIKIDRNNRTVRIKTISGNYTEVLNLTQTELAILAMLVGNEKQAISRDIMLEKLWGSEATEVYSNCINKHIETLRRKLGPFGKRIKTVYGSGYMFTGDKKA